MPTELLNRPAPEINFDNLFGPGFTAEMDALDSRVTGEVTATAVVHSLGEISLEGTVSQEEIDNFAATDSLLSDSDLAFLEEAGIASASFNGTLAEDEQQRLADIDQTMSMAAFDYLNSDAGRQAQAAQQAERQRRITLDLIEKDEKKKKKLQQSDVDLAA